MIATPPYLEVVGAELDRVLPPISLGGQRRDVSLSGTHLDLMREPNVGEVARVLDSQLLARSGLTRPQPTPGCSPVTR